LGKSFLEPCRGRKYDVNLKEVGSPGQLEWCQARNAFLHAPAEQKGDKQINSKASGKADGHNQAST
jgi:hypothetical protein